MNNTTEIIITLLVMATIVQFLVDRVKAILPDILQKYLSPPIISICISVLLAFMFELNMFAAMGVFTQYTYLAQILTAFAISAGAEPLHNLFAKFREMRFE